MNIPATRLALLLWCAVIAASAADSPAKTGLAIKELNLVHFSHTDVGFTDSPSVCRELYRRYLDIAVDAVLDSIHGPTDRRFFWTAESTLAVNDWWQAASPDRRKRFLKAVRSGQLEVSALACNNTPFMDAHQWQTMVRWLPDEVWKHVRPTVAIQDDVNGFPRAGAIALLDRGVRRLFTGINEDSGGVPFPRPSGFWWKLPDGRRLFVWLNIGYGSGFDFFESTEWRRGPVPRAADANFRPPRAGDILRNDEASVRAAHKLCVERLRHLEEAGYKHELLTISITSQWRFDNDPPFPPIAEFVAAWNRLGLEPRMHLTTASEAMARMEQILGPTAPVYEGEWTDWWANGSASAPREVAASRYAKRFLAAAQSPLWGPIDSQIQRTVDELYRDLCLFDEHTWGSSLSVAKPYSLDTQAQFTEKSILAFRPMARAEWLLSQRARTRLADAGEGFFLVNPADAPFCGWVRLTATCLRDKYEAIEDPATGQRMKLYFERGVQPWGRPQSPEDLSREDISATFPDRAPNQVAKFWVDRLDRGAIRKLRLSTHQVDVEPTTKADAPIISTDKQGWPTSARWPGMNQPLFIEGFGDLTAITVNGFAPRHALADIRSSRKEARERLRREKLLEVKATSENNATREETPHTILFTQPMLHPRLLWATRVVEIWKNEPRVRLSLRLNRSSSAAPEIFYLAFPLPTGNTLPSFSNGGQVFTPFTDQLPGTCRDYFAIDGWAKYSTPNGNWIWVSRDAPLVTLGDSATLSLREAEPSDPHRLLAMLFNNFWYTNFVADEHGIMEFQFDLIWRGSAVEDAGKLAAALVSDPITLINPELKEDPRVLKRLFHP